MRGGYHHKQKTVVLVKGGPGTGKTIIALNLMADLSGEGYNVRHATGSRAFTGNLKKILGFRAGEQFSFFNNYVSTEYNCVDVLLCDEAHRLRPNSNNRFQKIKSDKRQVDELVFSSKVAVFLIDDLQVVRPGEVGSCDLIRSAATGLVPSCRNSSWMASFAAPVRRILSVGWTPRSGSRRKSGSLAAGRPVRLSGLRRGAGYGRGDSREGHERIQRPPGRGLLLAVVKPRQLRPTQ